MKNNYIFLYLKFYVKLLIKSLEILRIYFNKRKRFYFNNNSIKNFSLLKFIKKLYTLLKYLYYILKFFNNVFFNNKIFYNYFYYWHKCNLNLNKIDKNIIEY